MKLTITTLTPVLAVLSFASSALGAYKFDIGEVDRQIRNKLSLIALAADTRNYGRFDEVFTKKALFRIVNPPSTFIGPEEIAKGTEEIGGNALTLTTVDTVTIDFFDKKHPNSTAYFIANFFGKSRERNDSLAIFGKYDDKWTFEKDSWKIKERIITIYVSRMLACRGMCL